MGASTLRLVRERKLAELIPPPPGGVLEASGVAARGRHSFVVFDNIRRVARIGLDLERASRTHQWQGRLRAGEGYEDIAYRQGRTPGGGRIVVLEKRARVWEPVALIKLPADLMFKDYAAVAVRGDRLAVLSQKSSRLWVGTLRCADWTVVGDGRTYDLPRSKKGKRLYCTVEGLDWLSADTFVMTSDLRKRGYPDRCGRTDQSIHIFRLTRR